MAQLIFENNVTSPSAPALGKVTLFAKSDSSLWIKLPTGEEYPLVTSSGVGVIIDSMRPFSDSDPLMNGVASQGIDNNISRDDHVHPSDTNKANAVHGHPAVDIAYTPTGNIAANNVQNAIMELDQEKAKLGIAVPLMNGVGSAGSDTDEASRQDHIHPSDSTKADLSHVNAQDAALASAIADLDGEVQTLDAKNVKKTSNTGTANLPAGTDAQRDVAPQVGAIRFSSTQLGWEGWNGINWVSIGGGQMLGNALVKGIFYNAIIIAENVTVKAGTNGLSAGEIQVANGFEVTVENGSTWSVV
jgi:hypothetical protein